MSACSVLANSQYGKRHDKIGTYVTGCCWRAVTYNAVTSGSHILHVPENDEYKILWDFNIPTDKITEHRRPDTVCINKQKRGFQIIHFAIPDGQNIAIKEQKKNWKVPGLKNWITETLKCQGSGHIGSYRRSRNYVEDNTSVCKTDWHSDRHNINQLSAIKTAILRIAYIQRRVLVI